LNTEFFEIELDGFPVEGSKRTEPGGCTREEDGEVGQSCECIVVLQFGGRQEMDVRLAGFWFSRQQGQNDFCFRCGSGQAHGAMERLRFTEGLLNLGTKPAKEM